MQISNRGLIEIASHEGVCLRPYRDSVGVLTIGVGHTAAAGPPDPALFPTSDDQAIGAMFSIFRNDLAKVEEEVNALVRVPLKQHQFDALCSFHFNTGGLGRAALRVALNNRDYDGAANGFMGWTKPPEIIGRRRKEQALFRDGLYSSGGKVNVFPVNARQQPVYSQGKMVDAASILGRDQAAVLPEPDIPPPRIVPKKYEETGPPPKLADAAPTPSPPRAGFFISWVRQLLGLN